MDKTQTFWFAVQEITTTKNKYYLDDCYIHRVDNFCYFKSKITINAKCNIEIIKRIQHFNVCMCVCGHLEACVLLSNNNQ